MAEFLGITCFFLVILLPVLVFAGTRHLVDSYFSTRSKD